MAVRSDSINVLSYGLCVDAFLSLLDIESGTALLDAAFCHRYKIKSARVHASYFII